MVVQPASALGPVLHGHELVEEPVGARHPGGREVDPRRLVEVDALERREALVERRRGISEEARLVTDVGGHTGA